jgi:dihydrofolate reductase
MGTIVVTEFVSLDGVVEDPGGVEGFEHGGWVLETNRGEEGEQFKFNEILASEALLLGRRTYDTFAASWPKRTGAWADRINSVPKYVVSSTLTNPTWNNTTVVGGPLDELAAKLKAAHDGDITVHGSTQLVQALLDQDLVDELRLMVFPVILGAGQRLFGEASTKRPQRLVETRTVGDGVTILTYASVRGAGTSVGDASLEEQRAAAFRRTGIAQKS